MACLPPKAAGVSDNDWIKQKSDDFWRPADFYTTLIQAGADYLSFVAQIAYSAGIPKEKIYSHSILHYTLQNGPGAAGVAYYAPYFDGALNAFSIPAYSLYGADLTAPKTLEYLRFLKSGRNVHQYALVEYADYGPLDTWRTRLNTIALASDTPKPVFVNFQNWDTIAYKFKPYASGGNARAPQTDATIYAGVAFMNELLQPSASFQTQHWAVNQGGIWDTMRWFSGDFNGDGKTDLAKFWSDRGQSGWASDVHLSSGSAFTMHRWATDQPNLVSDAQWLVGDFNGDNRSDFAVFWKDNGTWISDVALSKGSNFFLERWAMHQGRYVATQKWFVGKFDGDAKFDLVNVWNSKPSDYWGEMSSDAFVVAP